ncbi:MAG: calcium/sodium antiporter [Pseudomonadota bacterium]
MLIFLAITGGLILLIVGGETLVRGAVGLAERAGVAPLIVGIVILGFGTSMPELVTSLEASLAGAPGIAWGNVVGSNIANTLLILGAAALLAPFTVTGRAVWRDAGVALGATAFLVGLAVMGWVNIATGFLLLALLVIYIVTAYFHEKAHADDHGAAYDRSAAFESADPRLHEAFNGWGKPLLFTILGLAAVVLGGRFLVMGSIDLARIAGLSEGVIGLTIVAIGTSLPELVTSVMAALRREGEIAFGNVVGSNIYNVLGIGGVTAIAANGGVPPAFVTLDLPLLLGLAVGLMALLWVSRHLGRVTGGLMIVAYVAYILWLLLGHG